MNYIYIYIHNNDNDNSNNDSNNNSTNNSNILYYNIIQLRYLSAPCGARVRPPLPRGPFAASRGAASCREREGGLRKVEKGGSEKGYLKKIHLLVTSKGLEVDFQATFSDPPLGDTVAFVFWGWIAARTRLLYIYYYYYYYYCYCYYCCYYYLYYHYRCHYYYCNYYYY